MSFPNYATLRKAAEARPALSLEEVEQTAVLLNFLPKAELHTILALIMYHAMQEQGQWVSIMLPYEPRMMTAEAGPCFNCAKLPMLLLTIICLYVRKRVLGSL